MIRIGDLCRVISPKNSLRSQKIAIFTSFSVDASKDRVACYVKGGTLAIALCDPIMIDSSAAVQIITTDNEIGWIYLDEVEELDGLTS